jgi:multidrug efflux pump subunit AcrA (membrane-fusion protein)
VNVRFHVVRSNPPFLLPSTAIIIRSGPPRVAVVDANGAVRLRQVELGRDFGSTIEVTSGLNEQDRLIAAPADNVQDGMTVRPAGGPVSSEPAHH